MPAPRKPKKVFIQFAVALVVAVIFGAVAIFVGFMVIQGVSKNAATAQKEAQEKELAAKAERERYEKMLEQLKQAPRSYNVVKAVVDLSPGQPITKSMVTLAEVSERPAAGSLTLISHALGKLVRTPIMAGEPLDSAKLLDTGGFVEVEEGKRAITVQVDRIGGLNGALSPGVRVDVLTTVVGEAGQTITRTLLQNVLVIAVGNGGSSDSGGRGAPNLEAPAGKSKVKSGGDGNLAVTMVVSPKQAELLTLAGELGAFHLTLRNYSDRQRTNLAGADMTALMTDIQPAALKKDLPAPPAMPLEGNGFHNVNYAPGGNLPAPSPATANGPRFTMQIYRGTGAETVDFQQ